MDCMTGKEKKAVVTSLCLSFAVVPHHPLMHNPLYAFAWVLLALIKLSYIWNLCYLVFIQLSFMVLSG